MSNQDYHVVKIDESNHAYIVKLLTYGDTFNKGLTELIEFHKANKTKKTTKATTTTKPKHVRVTTAQEDIEK